MNSVFLTTNNGTNWIKRGMAEANILSLVVKGVNLFAGTKGSGVYHSTNNGISWTAVNTGLTDSVVQCLTTSGSNLFAATGKGVFYSTNNGINWIHTKMTISNVTSLAASGANLFAGTEGGGVLLTTNDGSSWAAVNEGLTNFYISSLAISGTNIFAGNVVGVYLSTNSGTSWTGVNSGFANANVMSLAANGTNLFAGTDGQGVWRRPLSEMVTSVEQSLNNQPSQFGLEQNYPNPFNPNTTINYRLPKSGQVTIKVYDVLGNEVKTLVNEYKPAGGYSINFDAGKLGSGVYIYRITAGGYTSAKKMTLIK